MASLWFKLYERFTLECSNFIVFFLRVISLSFLAQNSLKMDLRLLQAKHDQFYSLPLNQISLSSLNFLRDLSWAKYKSLELNSVTYTSS
jgi:hypothetical protein